jgi:ribonuclease P protein component
MADPQVVLGVMVPKRWAKRAVTRNSIKRQAFNVGKDFEARLPKAAYVVRLRSGLDRTEFRSANSEHLKAAMRLELEQLFCHATNRLSPNVTLPTP